MGTFPGSGAPAPRLFVLVGAICLAALAAVLFAMNDAARWADGYVAFRSPAEIDPRFWAAWATGVAAALASSWIWVLKPKDTAVRLYALSGLATLLFCFAGAGFVTHTVLSEALGWALVVINVTAASAFGLIMIALFAIYPTPLAGARWIVLGALGLFGGWLLWAMVDPQRLFVEVHRITLAEMTLIVVLGGAQVLAARGDPVRSAIAAWLGVCVLLGAGGFIATVAAPSAFGAPSLIDNEYAFCFFLIIYAGLAVGLLRYRVFGLGAWAFQLLFSVGAALAVLVVDAALILVLSFDPSAVIGLSLFAAALIYLPLRTWLWARLNTRKRLDEAALVRAMVDIGLQPVRAQRAVQWRALLEKTFSPLNVAVQAVAASKARLEDEGRALITPASASFPALILRDRDRGRALFAPHDAAMVDHLAALANYLDESRAAYDRGVETERARIARDIHDNIGAQLLSALHVGESGRKDELIRDAIGEIRAVVRNAAGAHESFEDVVADLRAETAERIEAQALEMDWRVEGAASGPPRPLAMLAMRALVREAISNVLRHAQARRAEILIAADGASLRLRVADDGVGLGEGGAHQGRGLANMKHRVASLGGRLDIGAGAPGTIIDATFAAFDDVAA